MYYLLLNHDDGYHDCGFQMLALFWPLPYLLLRRRTLSVSYSLCMSFNLVAQIMVSVINAFEIDSIQVCETRWLQLRRANYL
jgi:hypothetical protein